MSPIAREDPFLAGSLWDSVVDRTSQALAQRALQPIPTKLEVVRDGQAEFHLRILSSLVEKQVQRQQQSADFNPFLPCDPALLVAGVSETHLAVLNKYNVVDHHLLLVTRAFEEQESRLSPADFAAVARCLFEYPGLAFYNSGTKAGASQRHKHLQVLPLHQRHETIPLEPFWGVEQLAVETLAQLPSLDFEHRLVRLPETNQADVLAAHLTQAYESMLASWGWTQIDDSVPYNLLLTREWILMIPRRCESFQAISLNAMAFAGSFFVKTAVDRSQLLEQSPLAVLRSVTLPQTA